MANQRLSNKYVRGLVSTELQRRGFKVNLPPVKNKTVSYSAQRGRGRLCEIKVRGRIPRWIFTFGKFKPKPNYYFILYSPDQNFYIIPSSKIYKWLNGREKIFINKTIRGYLNKEYKNNFNLLANH